MKTALFDVPQSPYLVPFDGKFRVAKTETEPKERIRKKDMAAELASILEDVSDLQRKLYAQDKYSVLFVFQAMDAAGKDGTIRAVMSGVNPSGCQVFSFKSPSTTELDHDFLWRVYRCLPERGRIGIFNRSHYEEVLVVRVHPEYLSRQRLPRRVDLDQLWKERFSSIRAFEKHLARNGTVIVKFWLNVSRDEQRRRFLDRIDDPDANWKFSHGDVAERQHWDAYMNAYEEALNATSRAWAPWYAIPADHKPTMRVHVARIVRDTLRSLPLAYPTLSDDAREKMHAMKDELEND